MSRRNKHKTSYLGLTILIVLSFLFTFNIYESFINPTNKALNHELVSIQSSAIAINEIQQLSLNKNWTPKFDNSNFRIFNEHIKLLINNRLINQKLIVLQQVELSALVIKPPGFYFFYFHRNTEDLPLLS
jgi:hypothetical protein